MDCIMNYNWPGNVRELENLVEMFVVMKGIGYIDFEDLPDKIRQTTRKADQIAGRIEVPDEGLNLNKTISQFERDLLQKALKKSGGVKNRAAKLLNLNRTTFVEKLKRYNIS